MERITEYKALDNGTFKAVVEGITLGKDETLLLDNGLEVGVDVRVQNPYAITTKQRKKIFALCNDIEEHTGTPREYMRHMFMDYTALLYGYEEPISLSNCTKQTGIQLIDIIIQWCFSNDIPLNYKTSDLLKEDKSFLYAATLNRKCVICGQHADLAHREAVGAGRNRNKIDHYGSHVLALCRDHHSQQHNMGVDSFDKEYHLENSWLKVTPELNKKLKGQG